MAQQTQSKLENIISTSFPANHLLQFSIVKQEAEQSYKKAYFFFITLAPGVQAQGGGRTFDFNNRITMKVESYQISELAHALRSFARGQEVQLGPHSIYVDSGKSAYGTQGAGGKSLSVQKTLTQQKQNGPPPSPTVTFFFKVGSNQALGYSMSPYRALAIADKLQALSEKCDDLEMARGPIGAQTGAYENPNPMGFADTPPTGGNPFSNPPGTNAGPGNVAGNFAGAFNNFDDNVPF